MTTFLFILAFCVLGLVSCGGGGTSTVSSPDGPVPCYRSDEPNDTWQTANRIDPEAPLFLVEGNIHHNDIDHIACSLPSIDGHLVDISVDYAAGWNMEVQIVSIDATGAATSLWGGYDAWGDGNLSPDMPVEIPAGSAWVGMTIRQTQGYISESTRYTFTVEILD